MLKCRAIEYASSMENTPLFADVGLDSFIELPVCVDDGYRVARELAGDELNGRCWLVH